MQLVNKIEKLSDDMEDSIDTNLSSSKYLVAYLISDGDATTE